MENQKIAIKLDEHSESTKRTAGEIVDLLKVGCMTYADLEVGLESLLKMFSWDDPKFTQSDIVQEIRDIIEEEKNSLPLNKEKRCSYLGCKNEGALLDDVEVAPGAIEKKNICSEHEGQLVGNASMAGRKFKKLYKPYEASIDMNHKYVTLDWAYQQFRAQNSVIRTLKRKCNISTVICFVLSVASILITLLK